jgi:hypothetical protein
MSEEKNPATKSVDDRIILNVFEAMADTISNTVIEQRP